MRKQVQTPLRLKVPGDHPLKRLFRYTHQRRLHFATSIYFLDIRRDAITLDAKEKKVNKPKPLRVMIAECTISSRSVLVARTIQH